MSAVQQTFEGLIKTTSYDQHEIIENIIQLYCPDGIDLDPTYNKGGFYIRIPRPKYCYDIKPLRPEAQKADCRHLPFEDESVRSIMFDPPFFSTTQRSGKTGIMPDKYSYVESMKELYSLYADSLQELYRILLSRGILIFKCQDSVCGKKNFFVHVWIANEAEKAGFIAKDLFIKLNKSAPVSPNQWKQRHARKLHSYFWVFKKPPYYDPPAGGASRSIEEPA